MNAVELYNDLFPLGLLLYIFSLLFGFFWILSAVVDCESLGFKVMFTTLIITGTVILIISGIMQYTNEDVKAHLQERNKVTCECSCCHCNGVPGTSEN